MNTRRRAPMAASPSKKLPLPLLPLLLLLISVAITTNPVTSAIVQEEPDQPSPMLQRQKDAALRLLNGAFFYREYHNKSMNPSAADADSFLDLGRIQQDAHLLFGTIFSEMNLDLDELLEEAAAQAKEYARVQQAMTATTFSPVERVLQMLSIAQDPDCLEPEFNVQDPSYDPDEAVKVMRKCKVLVLRNAFDTEVLQDIKYDVTKYLLSLQKGTTSSKGHTSLGEESHWGNRHNGRWEVLLPADLTSPERTKSLLLNPRVVHNLLADDQILGQKLRLNGWGIIFASPGATPQTWHIDDPDLFDTTSWTTHGIGGHDLPAFAVTASIPLLPNYTRQHGPTEFCLGISALRGLTDEQIDLAAQTILNDSDQDSTTKQLLQEWFDMWFKVKKLQDKSCPLRQWRSPTGKFGDAIFWDYHMDHRGGRNKSNETRGALYLAYSREWYKDSNYQSVSDDRDGEFSLERMLVWPRTAVPDFDHRNECEECNPKHAGVLEEMGWLFPDNKVYMFDDEEFDVIISNKDLGMVQLLLNDEKVGPFLSSGDTVYLPVRPDDVLKVLRTEDGKLHDTFSIPKMASNQIILDQKGSRLAMK